MCSPFLHIGTEESMKDDDYTSVSEKSKDDYVLYRLYNKPENTSLVSQSVATGGLTRFQILYTTTKILEL